MSIKKILTTAVLAAAGVVLSALPAKALVYSAGDIFLGVRATGGDGATTVYLVNLGQHTQFLAGGSFAGTSIGADLTAIYGDWSNRSDLNWGIFGRTTDNQTTTTLYASRERTDVGTPSDPWPALTSSAARGGPLGAINDVITSYVTNGPSGASSYVPVNLQAGTQTSTYSNGYYSKVDTSPNFSTTSQWTNIEGSFANGTAGSVLDLFRVTGNVNTTGLLGSFHIDDLGNISYTAVPEPSTYALLALAAVAYFVFVRRRRAQQA